MGFENQTILEPGKNGVETSGIILDSPGKLPPGNREVNRGSMVLRLSPVPTRLDSGIHLRQETPKGQPPLYLYYACAYDSSADVSEMITSRPLWMISPLSWSLRNILDTTSRTVPIRDASWA